MKINSNLVIGLVVLALAYVVLTKTTEGFRKNEGFQLNDNAWINGFEWAGIVIGVLLVIFLFVKMSSRGGNSNNGY